MDKRPHIDGSSWTAGQLLMWLCLTLPSAGTGCQAEPPPGNPSATPPPLGSDRYANIAICTPQTGAGCSGTTCAGNERQLGTPQDGQTIRLDASCRVLDVLFTGGTVVPAETAGADMVIHFGQTNTQTIARVEASSDGDNYQVVAFINGTPPNVQADMRCVASVAGLQAPIELNRAVGGTMGCNTMTNIAQLRITPYLSNSSSTSALVIDAVEATEQAFQRGGSVGGQ